MCSPSFHTLNFSGIRIVSEEYTLMQFQNDIINSGERIGIFLEHVQKYGQYSDNRFGTNASESFRMQYE